MPEPAGQSVARAVENSRIRIKRVVVTIISIERGTRVAPDTRGAVNERSNYHENQRRYGRHFRLLCTYNSLQRVIS